MRGRKPKPTHLHIVDGTLERSRHAGRLESEPPSTGVPIKPRGLKGRSAALWDEYSARAPWLGEQDSHKLALWCGLCAELERGVAKMTAARIAQFRATGSELGFDPAGRARMAKPARGSKADPASKYFSPGSPAAS